MAKVIRTFYAVQYISLDDEPANGAVIIAHGGYTPRRNFFQRGSGTTTVPRNLHLFFYTSHDDPVAGGSRASDHAQTGKKWESANVMDMYLPSSTVTNYSISDAEDLQWNAGQIPASTNPQRLDVIMIAGGYKAYLSDVFKGIRALRLPYNVLHHYHCRVNKHTYGR